jgi:hypothetical protein
MVKMIDATFPDVNSMHIGSPDAVEYEATLPELPEQVEAIHYVDNDEMLAKYIEYQKKRAEAIASGKPEPVLTRYLGECILKICHRTAYKYNFINYSFRDEMISDAIENCIRGINSFDHTRSKYIFSYYTTTAWNAFVRRIQREAKQSAIKGRIISELDVDSIVTQEHDNGEYQADFVEYMKQASDFKLAHDKKAKPLDEEVEQLEFENALIFDGEE